MLSYIYGAQLLVLRVSRATRDATPKRGTRGVAWDFESVRTRKLEKSVRIFWNLFPKDISINEKMKNTRSSYNTTNAFYQKNLPISQVRTCVFAKRTPRLWYFVCFCTLLFSRKISHFSLCCHTISLGYLLKWAVENLVIFTTWEAFPSHFLHRGTVV